MIRYQINSVSSNFSEYFVADIKQTYGSVLLDPIHLLGFWDQRNYPEI
jgi:hypothetical protein